MGGEGTGYFRVVGSFLTQESMNKEMKIAVIVQFGPAQHAVLACSSPALGHAMPTAYS